MYKSRFTKWGFDVKHKKHKTHRVRLSRVIRPVHQRRRAAESEAHCEGGLELVTKDHAAIARASKTPEPISTQEVSQDLCHQQQRQHGPPNMFDCFFQPWVGSRTVSTNTRLPMQFPYNDISENIFYSIHSHIAMSFACKIWTPDENQVCSGAIDAEQETNTLAAFDSSIDSAVRLFEQGTATEAGQAVRKAFALVRSILAAGSVRVLEFSWNSLDQLLSSGHVRIAILLIRHIREMAEASLSASNPIAQMLRYLQYVDAADLEEFVHRT